MALLDAEKATEEFQQKAEEGYFDETDKSFKTDEWEERLHRALFTREEWEKVMKAMDEIYDIERKAREKGKKVLEDRNIEFIMPEATMDVDPIPDENIHTIDFAHGYDYCRNVMKKEIHKLFEDTMNGSAGEFIRGWNMALKKVLEVMESEGKDVERQKCDTCYHNETEYSICQYCTGGNKYEERYYDKVESEVSDEKG